MNDKLVRTKLVRTTLATFVLVGLGPWQTGCSMDQGAGEDQPPPIPPLSTFLIDFGDFTDSSAAKVAIGENDPRRQLVMRENWTWAATNAGVWNLLLTVTLVVPVAAFVESFNQQPTLNPDGSWSWNYDFMALGATYSAELQARTAGPDIQWDMFISREGSFQDVNWFSGVSNLVGTQGTWSLNRDPQSVTPFIDIAWNRDPINGTADIRYTNVVPGGAENGGFIFYGVTNDQPFDAFYQIFNLGEDNQTDIEWSRATKDGRVKDVDHFGDDEWRCWNESLEDTDCDAKGGEG